MRIKLSYTVNAKDVLGEAAKLLGLTSHDMQTAIDLYSKVQVQLRKAGTDEVGDGDLKAMVKIGEFRTSLLNIDTRLAEVEDIVLGYRKYVTEAPQEEPKDVHHEAIANLMSDNFGTD